MSTGLIVTPNNAIKAKEPVRVYISDGTIGFPYGHPEYFSRNQPDGMLLLDLQNNEYSEFRLDSDRDCDVTLYNHANGSRFKLFVYRTTPDSINITFNDKAETYVVPGDESGVKLLILDVEVAELNGILIGKIGPTSEKIEEIIGQLNTSSIRISEDIQFNGVEQGAYSDGSVIAKDTTLTEVLKRFAQKSLPVSYIQPVFGIVPNSQSVESGSYVNPLIVPSFLQNDAGALLSYVLKRDGAIVLNVGALENYQQANTQVADGGSLSFEAIASYAEGVTKVNNMGEPDPTGKILAGSKSDTLLYTGVRQVFYAAQALAGEPSASAEIRALAGTKMNPTNGTTLTVNIAAGTKRIVIAYPATLRDVSTIKYVELGNAEVKDTFNLVNISVEGANGYMAIPYKVYVYIPAVPFGSAATYNVTI